MTVHIPQAATISADTVVCFAANADEGGVCGGEGIWHLIIN